MGSKGDQDAGVFLWLWLGAEAIVLALLNRHSAHYYQPLVVPASLLAGAGVAWVVRAEQLAAGAERVRVLRWSAMITVALALPALMSFVMEAQRRWVGYDVSREVGAFAGRLAMGSP